MSDMAHMESQWYDCKHELNRDNNNRQARMEGKSLVDLKATSNLGILRIGEIIFSKEEHANWLSNTK